MNTINEAKDYLRINCKEGVNCPCCGQLVKVYKRVIYSTTARDLIKLYLMHETNGWDKYYHIVEILDEKKSGGGDFAKFLHWKLVEEMPKDENNTQKRTSGFWKLTSAGKMFVENKLKVRKYVLLYNSKVLGFEGDKINIKECLGENFNYEELMKR